MKTTRSSVAVLFLVIGILFGALGRTYIGPLETLTKAVGFVPSVELAGDIETPFKMDTYQGFSIQEFQYKGEAFNGIKLSEILKKASPLWPEHQILLIGDDGFSASIGGSNLEGCYIHFSEANGWEAINLYHPISSNVKRLKEIVVISNNAPIDFGVNIITADQNVLNLTPGNLYKGLMSIIPRFEGTSTMKHEGVKRSTSIYTRRKIFPIESLLKDIQGEKLIIMGSLGEYVFIDRTGYLELKGNKISYLPSERGRGIDSVKGIIVDPPSTSIMDLYHDSLHCLKRGEKVLAIFVDGYGYHQYLHTLAEGYAPYLSTLPKAKKALGVYQPVTNAGFAAMITGSTPEENGVYSRNQRQLKVPTVFGRAQEMGKKAILIQGDRQVLDLEIQPVFNLDLNKSGTADDEIFETAKEYLPADYDFLMVHFKNVDATGHSYGDMHNSTLEAIRTVDGYIKELVNGWDGVVIITADHGMHSTKDAGNHGVFRFEDMVVPYIVTEGGRKD